MNREKLIEIRNNLTALPILEARAERLRLNIDEAEKNIQLLLHKYEEESLDVEQLKKESLSTSLLKFIGRYEGKFDKEIKEMLAAKIEYDKTCERVKDLYHELDVLSKRITILKEEKETYEEELKNREQDISNHINTNISNQYKQLEEKSIMLNRQLVEIDEAILAIRRVEDTADSAIKHLESAENWATYDIWFRGGILSHMAKYEHIDEAESDFNRLSSQLKDLQKELSDINVIDIPQLIGIDSATRAIDFWFDNIFTDLNVRDQIQGDNEQIRALLNKIEDILHHIQKNRAEIIKTLEVIEISKEELIISL